MPDGTVRNAPQIANKSGHADKAVSIDHDRDDETVLYRETEGRYEDKHVHYASFDSSSPQRQGLNSAILDKMDPHNILHEVPVLPLHADVGSTGYAPEWDVHLAEWTQTAIAAGDRAELRSTDEVDQRVAAGLVTGLGGTTFGASGFIVNCPLISIDIP